MDIFHPVTTPRRWWMGQGLKEYVRNTRGSFILGGIVHSRKHGLGFVEVKELDSKETVILCCREGLRSASVCRLLQGDEACFDRGVDFLLVSSTLGTLVIERLRSSPDRPLPLLVQHPHHIWTPMTQPNRRSSCVMWRRVLPI